jgi:hypothetical protein
VPRLEKHTFSTIHNNSCAKYICPNVPQPRHWSCCNGVANILSGGDSASWLTGLGGGVNVCNKSGDGSNNYINNINNKPTLSGQEWQCVELINRLYLSKGWITSNWYGNGGGSVGLIYYLPPSLSNSEQNNGSVTAVNPGDVITFNLNGSPTGSGHTAIINTVGTTIDIINQNTQALHSTASLTSGIVSMAANTWTNYTVQAIIHAPTGTPPPPVISTLRTIPTSDGHIQTFKITSGILSENWYNWGNGNRTGAWTQPITMPSIPTGTPALVQRTGQTKIDVFVHGTNNQIYETWYDYSNAQWGGWINMGGNITSDPQAVATSDGHEQVFDTGSNLIQENWFNPNVTINNVGGWANAQSLPANAVGSPTLAPRSGQNTIDEFVRGGDNQIYEMWYNWGNGQWGGWTSMGGYVTSDPQVTTTSDGHDQVFGTTSNLVKQSWYYVNGNVGGWTTSQILPSITTTSSPAVVLRTGQGVIDEFIRGSDNQIYQTWYDSGAGGWGGWLNMGDTTTSDPQGIATSDNHDQIFGTNNSQVTQNWFDRVDGTIGGWIGF